MMYLVGKFQKHVDTLIPRGLPVNLLPVRHEIRPSNITVDTVCIELKAVITIVVHDTNKKKRTFERGKVLTNEVRYNPVCSGASVQQLRL